MKKLFFITNFDGTIQNTLEFEDNYPLHKLVIFEDNNNIAIVNEHGEEIDRCNGYITLKALVKRMEGKYKKDKERRFAMKKKGLID